MSVQGPKSSAQLFTQFLRFGFLAWGGPVAQVAMIRRELVDEQRWIPTSRFNRLLAVYQVLPGPEAHELCVHMGMLRAGRLGGVLAGIGFMLPGLILMLTLSWLYFEVDLTSPAISAALVGVQVAVIALIVRAIHRIGSHVLVNSGLWLVGTLALVASATGITFWIVLPIAGVSHAVLAHYAYSWRHPAVMTVVAAVVLATTAAALHWLANPTAVAVPVDGPPSAMTASLAELFVSGLRAGLLTFGGAYTVIPFLRGDAVGRGWLTDQQFLDGLALSGILPAPLIIFSTFVGFVGAGFLGALAMTIGIFLPAFAFSLLFGDRLESLVNNEALHAFLEGVAAGVVGLIGFTTFELAGAAVGVVPAPLPALAIFAGALAVLFVSKAKTTVVWVVAAAAFAGFVAFQVLA